MADNAPQKQYRQEMIMGFEQHTSLLRQSCTTESVIKGNEAIFLVVDSGSASAKTRGLDGLIVARPDNNTQNTCTLSEWHDLVRKTKFNIFESQGDQRMAMQRTTMAVVNRKIDDQIITELNTATNDTGTAATASLSMAVHAKTILGNNAVPWDGQITALITPAFEAYLLQTKEFGSADYVTKMPLENAGEAWMDQMGYYKWIGVNWIVHPNLPGAATSAEKCFMYHRSAIGHAANSAGIDTNIGYNGEQDYSWCRCSMFMGAKLLQNSGVVVMNHDGSGFAAS